VNLGWKLAAEVAGWAPDGLLDTYHAERHEIGRQVLSNIEAQALLLLGGPEADPTRAVLAELIGYPEVRDRLAGLVSGLDVRYGRDPHPLVGARMPDIDLCSGHGVLLTGGRHAWLRAVTAPWRGRVDVVASPLDGPETVLVRPDGHVAWVGDRASDPRPPLSRWFGPG
jgi:oxygenase